MNFAPRMARLGTESAFEVLARARQLERTGREIIHLEIGEPDFDTPAHIKEAAPEIIVQSGVLGRCQPSAHDRADIAYALKLIAVLGPFDVGQAVVVADTRVLAIEAAEGTDRMLARIAELRQVGTAIPTATKKGESE